MQTRFSVRQKFPAQKDLSKIKSKLEEIMSDYLCPLLFLFPHPVSLYFSLFSHFFNYRESLWSFINVEKFGPVNSALNIKCWHYRYKSEKHFFIQDWCIKKAAKLRPSHRVAENWCTSVTNGVPFCILKIILLSERAQRQGRNYWSATHSSTFSFSSSSFWIRIYTCEDTNQSLLFFFGTLFFAYQKTVGSQKVEYHSYIFDQSIESLWHLSRNSIHLPFKTDDSIASKAKVTIWEKRDKHFRHFISLRYNLFFSNRIDEKIVFDDISESFGCWMGTKTCAWMFESGIDKCA